MRASIQFAGTPLSMLMNTKQTPPVCNYEDSDYQRTFWDQGDREYEDRVEAVALRRLLPESGKKMLELGAGAGRNTPRYAGFEHVVLVDYSLTQLQQAQQRLGRGENYTYVAANIYKLPFQAGVFDAATMIRTLHHMADAPLALHEVRKVLRSGGIFILEFANKLNLKAILRYLFGRQDWNPFTPEPVEFVELNFDFHPAAVREWLHEAGFVVQRQLTVSHFRLGAFKRFVPLGLLVKMDSAAQLTGDFWQLTPSVFVASEAIGKTLSIDSESIFGCPECGQTLLKTRKNEMHCLGCDRRWPIVDGIYDFRDV